MKILIVEDHPASRQLIENHVARLGHEPIGVTDGPQALARFVAEPPDMVLMDVNLPGMNGMQVTRELRQLSGHHWVPILFISAYNDRRDILQGLEAGADDYLTKPLDLALLSAKIGAMQRIADLQAELAAAHAKLAAHQADMEAEQEIARDLLRSMVDAGTHEAGLDIWQLPASTFCGDLTVASRGCGGEVFLMLADSAGHGLPAALPLLPITEVFQELAPLGHSVGGLAKAMNRRLRRMVPRWRFVAVSLARIDPVNGIVEVWNGGCPPAMLIGGDGRVLHQFVSRHPPLGLLDDGDFESCSEAYAWSEPCRLVTYSDGVTEARNADGEMFGETRMLAAFSEPSRLLDRLKRALLAHMGTDRSEDDISVMVVECGMRSQGGSDAP